MIIDDASIRVHIKSKPCSRATAVVSSTRTNAVARAASLPENRGKVRRMLTLLYGLCPLAHLAAFEGALSAARGEDEKLDGSKLERQRLLADAVRLEGLTENLRVLLWKPLVWSLKAKRSMSCRGICRRHRLLNPLTLVLSGVCAPSFLRQPALCLSSR